MSLGEGIQRLPGWQRTAGWTWARGSARLWLGGGVSFLGYVALFLALHLRSLGWAPGQVLEPFDGYWQLFYGLIFDQDRVLASRRSELATLHPMLLACSLGIIAAGYLALLVSMRTLPVTSRPRLRTLIGMSLLFSVPLLILPNLLSGDVYSYISFGRIATLFAGNPFIDPPNRFPYDMYYQWVGWSDVPSVYGPSWIYLSILLTVLVETLHSTVISYVLAYKLLALLLHLFNGFLIWKILAYWKPEQQVWGAALYLLNPLALIEFAGSGHNDALMISFILLGILCHLRGLRLWTATAFTLAILTKWIALPLLPLYGIVLLTRARSWRSRLLYVAGSVAIFIGLSAGLYLPYWDGLATLKVLVDAPPQQRLINSLGELVVHETQYGMYLLGRWPHPAMAEFSPLTLPRSQWSEMEEIDGQLWRSAQRTRLQRYNRTQLTQQLQVRSHERLLSTSVRVAGLGIFVVACGAAALLTRGLRTLLLATAWLFFVYTTITAVWVWPWYATWFVALAALLDWRVTGRAALLLSLLALFLYPLFPAMPEPGLIIRWRAMVVFGPPLAFAGFHLVRIVRAYRRGEWSLEQTG